MAQCLPRDRRVAAVVEPAIALLFRWACSASGRGGPHGGSGRVRFGALAYAPSCGVAWPQQAADWLSASVWLLVTAFKLRQLAFIGFYLLLKMLFSGGWLECPVLPMAPKV